MNENYDSTPDTLKHIKRVAQLLTEAAAELINRANVHDESKLKEPEKAFFDEYTPKLAACTYGSAQYKEFLSQLQVGLKHHYAKNSHHPEHYENGVDAAKKISKPKAKKKASKYHEKIIVGGSFEQLLNAAINPANPIKK